VAFDVIIGAELIYFRVDVHALMVTAASLLSSAGIAILVHVNRLPDGTNALCAAAIDAGLHICFVPLRRALSTVDHRQQRDGPDADDSAAPVLTGQQHDDVPVLAAAHRIEFVVLSKCIAAAKRFVDATCGTGSSTGADDGFCWDCAPAPVSSVTAPDDDFLAGMEL
jgi:hypothetical protein